MTGTESIRKRFFPLFIREGQVCDTRRGNGNENIVSRQQGIFPTTNDQNDHGDYA